MILKFLRFFIVGYAYISHLAHTLFFCPRHGMVWCGCFYFISLCFIIPLELEKSKWVAVCAFCVLFYALLSFHLVLSFTFAFTVLLPVDAEAYAYPALVNSHISSFFDSILQSVLSHSLTYIPSGGVSHMLHLIFFIPSPLQDFLFQGTNFAVGWSISSDLFSFVNGGVAILIIYMRIFLL